MLLWLGVCTFPLRLIVGNFLHFWLGDVDVSDEYCSSFHTIIFNSLADTELHITAHHFAFGKAFCKLVHMGRSILRCDCECWLLRLCCRNQYCFFSQSFRMYVCERNVMSFWQLAILPVRSFSQLSILLMKSFPQLPVLFYTDIHLLNFTLLTDCCRGNILVRGI